MAEIIPDDWTGNTGQGIYDSKGNYDVFLH